MPLKTCAIRVRGWNGQVCIENAHVTEGHSLYQGQRKCASQSPVRVSPQQMNSKLPHLSSESCPHAGVREPLPTTRHAVAESQRRFPARRSEPLSRIPGLCDTLFCDLKMTWSLVVPGHVPVTSASPVSPHHLAILGTPQGSVSSTLGPALASLEDSPPPPTNVSEKHN